MSNISLDASAVATMQADMNVKTSVLSDEQLNALAQKLNEKFNIPILGEKIELIVFAKIIRLIDAKLYELLPNEYYSLINSISDGISETDPEMMTTRFSKLLNEKINIPCISEQKEEKLINLVIRYIVGAMVKGAKFCGQFTQTGLELMPAISTKLNTFSFHLYLLRVFRHEIRI